MEKWNTQFGRWVNKGAKGIAVFDGEHDGSTRLKHYFDISDTHAGQNARPVPLWQMEPGCEAEVIEHLGNTFGELEDTSTLAAALLSAAKNAVEDNLTDYLSGLMECRDDSLLEELDSLNVEVAYRTALQSSVAYMLLTRCGIDADAHLDAEDFRQITNFNTPRTVNALGVASGDISEACLREIAATVTRLQKRDRANNQTLAMPGRSGDNKINNEGGLEHGKLDLQTGGGLSGAQPDAAGGTGRNQQAGLREIRAAAQEISQTAPPHLVRQSADKRHTQRASGGDRADGERADGADGIADGGGAGRERADESVRSNEMGRSDEQHSAGGGGSDSQRPDLRIKPLPAQAAQIEIISEAEDDSSAFSFSGEIPQDVIDGELTRGSGVFQLKFRIYQHFKESYSADETAKFLKNEYGIGGHSPLGGSEYDVEKSGKGLTFSKSDLLHPDVKVIILLIDERPEEVTDFRRAVDAEVVASSLDREIESHVRLAQLVLERCRRSVATGAAAVGLPVDMSTMISPSWQESRSPPTDPAGF